MDAIIIDGDQVNFLPVFGSALVSVQPGKIVASGKATIKGKKVCVDGDEAKVEVTNCSYVAPPFIVPGQGTLIIKKLGSDQLTKKSKSGTKSIILKGNMFIAEFKVTTQAKQPPPTNAPDPVPMYPGQGELIPTNTKIQAT